jgi:molybdate transport system regulatory protein
MKTKRNESESGARLAPRLRVLAGDETPLGPGKADLLAAIRETHSLNQAAARMGMSYMRAWTLVKAMNRGFREPLVDLSRGGAGGGGARLTDAGDSALDLYREMESACLRATRPAWRRLAGMLADTGDPERAAGRPKRSVKTADAP